MKNEANKNISLFDAGKRVCALALPMAVTQFINVSSGFLCKAMLANVSETK